jgi:hypothetical protein
MNAAFHRTLACLQSDTVELSKRTFGDTTQKRLSTTFLRIMEHPPGSCSSVGSKFRESNYREFGNVGKTGRLGTFLHATFFAQ